MVSLPQYTSCRIDGDGAREKRSVNKHCPSNESQLYPKSSRGPSVVQLEDETFHEGGRMGFPCHRDGIVLGTALLRQDPGRSRSCVQKDK